MKKKRPFFWIIIFLNFFFIMNFFVGREGVYIREGDPDVVILNQFQLLLVWLVMMNIVLYVIYWVTGRKKGNKKGLQE
jgi:hypothetical protein